MVMNEAIPKEDFDRLEEGKVPLPKKKIVREEPKPPKVSNEIKLVDIPEKDIVDFRSQRHDIRNEDGVIFCGFLVEIDLKGSNQPMQGWIQPKDYYDLKRIIQPIIKESNLREW